MLLGALMIRVLTLFTMLFLPAIGFAQSLTPEQLKALIDERVAAQNPFAEMLNDPDPVRSMAAMEIMLESGDDHLIGIALEFGLLSTNPSVKRTAVEAYLASNPVLTVRIDGENVENRNYPSTISQQKGTLTPEGIGYVRVQVGDYDPAQKCYLSVVKKECLFTSNSDGIIMSNDGWMTGRLVIGEAGVLNGSANLYNVTGAMPISIKLLD